MIIKSLAENFFQLMSNKVNLQFTVVLLCSTLMFSCATEFEKIRSSNDAKLILEKGHEYFEKGDYAAAQSLYELAVQTYRGRAEAEKLFFNYAYTFYYSGEFITASYYFKNFANTYYNSDKREEADFMAAYSNVRLSPNYRLDQTYSIKAIEGLQEFVNKYPYSDRIDECNKIIDQMRTKLEQKSFEQGLLYYNMGQYQAANHSFLGTLKDFPGSKNEDEIKYLLIKSNYNLAVNSIIGKREERLQETVALCNKYKEKIKNRAFKKEVGDIQKSAINQLKSMRS